MINYNLTHMKLNTFIMYTLLFISASYVYEKILHKRKSESTRFFEEYISERLFLKLVKLGEGIHPFKNIYQFINWHFNKPFICISLHHHPNPQDKLSTASSNLCTPNLIYPDSKWLFQPNQEPFHRSQYCIIKSH